jgi:DNA recombination protein RmuC
MGYALVGMAGVVVGASVVLVVVWLRRRPAAELAQQLLAQAEQQRLQELQTTLDQVKGAFGELSRQALTQNNEQFLQLAQTRLAAQTKEGESALDARKKLIDETVKQIGVRLQEVNQALQTQEQHRRQAHGTLVERLEAATRTTAQLQSTTAQLREALANPQRRGQWGERMAEDVLRLAGFIEGVNYSKQQQTASGERPDFTFFLPQKRVVNMDVKFPLPQYLAYLDATEDAAREQAKTAFLRDVRARIKEVTGREYIDPESGTVDYVLIFIPNEQIYGFIHQHDPTLLDDALAKRVVLCAPLTLYAILAVIRQAAESLRIEEASREILALLAAFGKEWIKYSELMDRMGKALESAQKSYDALTTTRARKLERQLDRIEELRSARGVALPQGGEGPPPAEA